VNLIWDNALKYNGPAHDVAIAGQQLKVVFEKKWAAVKKKEGSGQQRTKSSSKSKASKNVPEMTYDEKRQLCIAISRLESKHLGKIVQIIHHGHSDIFKTYNQDAEEIEIDLDGLDTPVLRELEKYVNQISN